MPTDRPATDAPAKGAILILVATAGIVLMNTCAKRISDRYGPIELVFYRGSVALMLLIPFMLATRRRGLFKTRRIKAHLCRAAVGNLGVAFVFWAYALLPMADATALLFSAPLFVIVLSPWLLKERVDRRRWTAVSIGFVGIVLIADPSSGLLSNPAALVGLAAALCVALVDMALRNLGQTDDPLTTVFYFLLIGVLISAPVVFLTGSPPTGRSLPWMVALGVFSVIQQVAKTSAYRLAEASFLAPYTYTAIVWATAAGWLFWHELPNTAVIAGTLVVVGCNLYLLRQGRPRP